MKYEIDYSRASSVNTCRVTKMRVTPEIQGEMLCGKKDLSYKNKNYDHGKFHDAFGISVVRRPFREQLVLG